jgi:L-lactate utilization protein LutB
MTTTLEPAVVTGPTGADLDTSVLTPVHVTEACIALGCAQSTSNCPIALALHQLVNEHTQVNVGAFEIELYHVPTLQHWSIPLPRAGRFFIHDFDENITVKPFTFSVPLPREVLK